MAVFRLSLQSKTIRIRKCLRNHHILSVCIREVFTLQSIRIPNGSDYTTNPEIGDSLTEQS